jgi:hypothetical protein
VVETSEGYLDRMDTVEEPRADSDPERRLESKQVREKFRKYWAA